MKLTENTQQKRNFSEYRNESNIIISGTQMPVAVIHFREQPLFLREGITSTQLKQLIAFSNSDTEIQRYTKDKERFGTKDAFLAWAAKGRVLYCLSDLEGNLAAIMWFGEKNMPTADYRFPLNSHDYPYTQAMRMYGNFRGQHLAVQFADTANKLFAERKDTRNGGIWIDPDADNQKSLITFSKANPGFMQVSPPNGHNRIVLINPSISNGTLAEEQRLSQAAYTPFPQIENFAIETDGNGIVYAVFFQDSEHSYLLEVKPGEFIPKSGLLMAKHLSEAVAGKEVLDIGTGTGFLAIHAAVHGAKRVVGIDLDITALDWAKHNSEINGLSNVSWREGNVFSSLESNEQFDLIVSNPPQMPMVSGHMHDWGGINGREIIEQIINQAPTHLRAGGSVYLVLFDFLGIDTSYSDIPPLTQVFNNAGFDVGIIEGGQRKIRRGGQTEKSLEYILAQYPQFAFTQNASEVSHHMYVVCAKLRDQN